jgi:F0F1-type ATP synthase assembly protein I
MNPYAAPVAPPIDDRTNPDFQVIQPTSRLSRVLVTIPPVILLIIGAVVAILRRRPLFFLPGLFGGVIGALPSCIGVWWISRRLAAQLRRYPIVLDGQALYGG